MYNWLIQADLTDKLLEVVCPCPSVSSRAAASEEISKWAPAVQVNSPYLEEHLMHMIKQDQNKVHNMDLLWRYYEKSCSFGKAAHVLARLADMQRWGGFPLTSVGAELVSESECSGFWPAALRSR